MEKSLETISGKFNLFDIFSVLIPGMAFTGLAGLSLAGIWMDKWRSLGPAKYFAAVFGAYLCGLLLQGISTVAAEFWNRIRHRKTIRETFLLECKPGNKDRGIYDNRLSYQNALRTRQMIIDDLELEIPDGAGKEEINSMVFSYCLNFCEMHGLAGKAEKMMALSDMYRSLSCGMLLVVLLNMGLLAYCRTAWCFFVTESIGLLACAWIFFRQKTQYEHYRYRILLREFYLYHQNQKQKKKISIHVNHRK